MDSENGGTGTNVPSSLLLADLIADYSHAWPNEDAGTKAHRTSMLDRIQSLAGDVASIEEIARLAPELNHSNYDHDDVCRLNVAMCELYGIVRMYHPSANNRSSVSGPAAGTE